MENINLEKTKYTPKINLDAINGTIDIVGDSYPKDCFEFYENIQLWLKEYFKNYQGLTKINIELPYINSSSLKIFKDGSKIEINWIYDEENDISEETGKDFQLDFEDLNIKLISKKVK